MGGFAALEPLTPTTLVTGARIDLTAAILTLAAAILYAIGVRRLARRGRRWSPTRSLSFATGIVMLLIATQSGLAAYDTLLFSAHVAQHVLLGVEGVEPHYELTVERPGASDEVRVRCEAGGDREGVAERVHAALRERTGLGIEVELVEPGTLPRSEGKAARVIDRRVSPSS